MTNQIFERTSLLIGEEGVDKLKNAKVAVFGIGGVGGYVVEALARSGIGFFLLVDKDTVDVTNINRQIIALHSTVGRAKVEVMQDRIADINPEASVEIRQCFYLPENADTFDFSGLSYVVDAVDTVAAKISIIERAKKAGVPVISCMGAGNKLDPTRFEVADISETSVCPLARVMRRELKNRGIQDVKVVYSREETVAAAAAKKDSSETEQSGKGECPNAVDGSEGKDAVASGSTVVTSASPSRKRIPGSIAFVPSVAGLILAGEVIRDLCR